MVMRARNNAAQPMQGQQQPQPPQQQYQPPQQQYQPPQQQYQPPQAPPMQQQQQYQPPQQQYQPPQAPPMPPAPLQQNTGVAVSSGATSAADLNRGIIEGIDGIDGGNRVSIQMLNFIYRQTQALVSYLDVVITSGSRVYQYWDDNSSLCQSHDGKVSDDGLICAQCEHKRSKKCKFKMEIHWDEENPETGEPEDVVMTMPTVSAIAFVDYLKMLAKQDLAVNQVITRMSLEPRQGKDDKGRTTTYSVIKFESLGLVNLDG